MRPFEMCLTSGGAIGALMLPSKVTATDSKGDWVFRFRTITLNTGDEKLMDVPPRVADLSELMRLHEQQRTAHMTYDAKLLTDDFAQQLVEIQRGNVRTLTRDKAFARFDSYFTSFKFSEWQDVIPPVIRMSKDGSLATVIVQKSVRGASNNENGEQAVDHTIYAWLEVWEKGDKGWKLVTIASTDTPGPK